MNTSNPWGLTQRQQEVLDLVSEGLMAYEIAARMGLSLRTINFHRDCALKRMSVPNSVREAVLWDRFAMGRTEGGQA